MVDQALHTVGSWLAVLLGLLFGVFAVIEGAFHTALIQLGVPANVQPFLLVMLTIILIIIFLRVFGGILRLLLVLFLLLLAIHVLLPSLGR